MPGRLFTKHLTARAPISRRRETRAAVSKAGTLVNKTPHHTGANLPTTAEGAGVTKKVEKIEPAENLLNGSDLAGTATAHCENMSEGRGSPEGKFFFSDVRDLTTTKLNPVKKSGLYVPVRLMKDYHVWSFQRFGCSSHGDMTSVISPQNLKNLTCRALPQNLLGQIERNFVGLTRTCWRSI